MSTTPALTTMELTTLLTPTQVPNTSVLILSTFFTDNYPIIIDSNGNQQTNIFKVDDDAEVSLSCAVTYQGLFYVYGGSSAKTQIATIEDCSLKKSTSRHLPFEVEAAECTVANDNIYLCFGKENSYNTCHKASDPTGPFVELSEKSTDSHGKTRIASSSSKSSILTFVNSI